MTRRPLCRCHCRTSFRNHVEWYKQSGAINNALVSTATAQGQKEGGDLDRGWGYPSDHNFHTDRDSPCPFFILSRQNSVVVFRTDQDQSESVIAPFFHHS